MSELSVPDLVSERNQSDTGAHDDNPSQTADEGDSDGRGSQDGQSQVAEIGPVGLLVQTPGRELAGAGIESGDVVLEVNGYRFDNPTETRRAIREVRDAVTFREYLVVRDGERRVFRDSGRSYLLTARTGEFEYVVHRSIFDYLDIFEDGDVGVMEPADPGALDAPRRIVAIPEGSPFRQLGLRRGDRLISLGDSLSPDFDSLVAAMRSADEPLSLLVERDGTDVVLVFGVTDNYEAMQLNR